MKNLLVLVIIVAVGWGAYSFLSKEPLPDQNTPAAKMFRDYEAIIAKYEKQGVKSQEDAVKLTADMRVFMTTSQTVTLKPEEAQDYMKKGRELNNRVMKLIHGN